MTNKNEKRNIGNIFYGVIGIATLMIAVMGATFAYYTATATDDNSLTGNMATIQFDLSVTKMTDVDESKGGMIPMSNNMVQQALSNASTKGICVDDNGNSVCQVYKIVVSNTSTANMFLDGYITLTGGSGTPADFTYADGFTATTMRWAQAFCTAEADNKVTTCTTTGNSTVRSDETITLAALGGTTTQANGLNTAEILSARDNITSTATISGNTYEIINKNYIRVSQHTTGSYAYKRADDTTSALVYNQYLLANDNNATNNTGTSATTTFTDSQVYYFVVWLSENGHNQTAGATGTGVNATNFFRGNVTFVSAQGSEVTATFSGHTKVTPNT